MMRGPPYSAPYPAALSLEPEEGDEEEANNEVEYYPEEEPEIAAEEEPAPAPADPEATYASLHPVYTRCKAKVDMLGFSLAIQKSCGDIHELTDVAWPCRSAMSDYSKKVRPLHILPF
jgi:hypothetical protein